MAAADNRGALNEACRQRNLKMAESLLQNNADVNALHPFDDADEIYRINGVAPLMSPLASLFNAIDVEYNAALDIQCECKWENPTSSSCVGIVDVDMCYRMTRLLVSYGAKLGPSDMETMIDAVMYANLETVRLLVNDANGDLNYLSRNEGWQDWSCLHSAVWNNQPGVLEYVLGVFKSENWDIDSLNNFGLTPLMVACEPSYKNKKVAKMLLKSGADFCIRKRSEGSFDILISDERTYPELAWLHFHLGFDIQHCDMKRLNKAVRSESPWMKNIVAEIARKEVMGIQIVGANLLVPNLDEQARHHLSYCKEQLREMQKMAFYENVSFWDVLSADKAKLTEYAENSELVEALFNTKCNGSFPSYCTRIRHRFIETLPRNSLIDLSAFVVSETTKRPTMFEVMQHEVMTYLEDDDFFKILGCCSIP